MKRPSSDGEMDHPFPLAKKVCLPESQRDDPPSPRTPIDDVDDDEDLYGDPPAHPKSQRDYAVEAVVNNAPQPPPPHLQSESTFQLPGLSMSVVGSRQPDHTPNREKQIPNRDDSSPMLPNGKLPTTQLQQSLYKPVKIDANSNHMTPEDLQENRTRQCKQSGTSDVNPSPVFRGFNPPESNEHLANEINASSLEPQQLNRLQETNGEISETLQAFEEVAEVIKNDDGAEFELDSSPVESSSESDTGSSSSSSENSAEDSDYQMLDPAEEARRLMEEYGGSDDEGKESKSASGPLRTLNEKPDEIVPQPQIDVTPSMNIAELGRVEHVVENSILIKAKTSGENHALESGSLLCLEDRSVVGVIAETLGQVQQPYYSVRFTNAAAITETGISKGTPVFYVEQHSYYVFTQNLKAIKGSDASNKHDEEVLKDEELEFSDDEAEAEHKRKVKQERQAKREGRADRGDGFARGPGGGRMRRGGRFNRPDGRNLEPPPISYDDQDDGEDLYTPLARPSNLHEVMGHREAPQENFYNRINGRSDSQDPRRGPTDRGRGRGDRDHGRGRGGGRGDRKSGRGFNRDFQHRQYDNHQQQQQNHAPSPPPPTHINPDLSFPTQNAHQLPSSYGWPNPHASNLYNPPNNSSYHQSSPFHQHQPYPYQNSNPYQYPQTHSSPQHAPAFPFPTLQSPQQHCSAQQGSSPIVPPNIPPGAHINPAFFYPTTQQPAESWQQQQIYSNPPTAGGSRSPQSEAAYQAAQDRLSLLRQLSQGGGP
ncbi:MAG: hypothetical protein LQ338_004373 [Usnochroma carphineum]|nr:MAG: hypothetical protein LQ338_004373 [Usnochroma carphineum]